MNRFSTRRDRCPLSDGNSDTNSDSDSDAERRPVRGATGSPRPPPVEPRSSSIIRTMDTVTIGGHEIPRSVLQDMKVRLLLATANGDAIDEKLIERVFGESLAAGSDIANAGARALAYGGKDAAAIKAILADTLRQQSSD